METKQTDWEFVANLGDVNVADYGGFIVYRDKTGVYGPEVELYEPREGEGEGGTVYRFVLEPLQFMTCCHNGGPCPGYPNGCPTPIPHNEWFVDELADVAESVGQTEADLRADLDSSDPIKRARGYWALVGYFGPSEFDSYPMDLSESEAQARYASIRGVR